MKKQELQINIRLSKELLEQFRILADKKQVSVSSLLRMIMAEYLERNILMQQILWLDITKQKEEERMKDRKLS